MILIVLTIVHFNGTSVHSFYNKYMKESESSMPSFHADAPMDFRSLSEDIQRVRQKVVQCKNELDDVVMGSGDIAASIVRRCFRPEEHGHGVLKKACSALGRASSKSTKQVPKLYY